MLRVVQLSSTDRVGGAAMAAHRLHEALNAGEAARSQMYVAMAEQPGPDITVFDPSGTGNATLARLAFKIGRRLTHRVRPPNHTLFTLDWTAFGRRPLRQLPAADIYHLHWVTDLLDFRMLPEMARRAPLVWTLHDMNPFTGGCHYDGGCGRHAAVCGTCPILESRDPLDPSHRALDRKARALAALPDHGLHIITPSHWMARQAKRSRLFERFEVSVVPNGIDTAQFCPVDRLEVRDRLGVRPGERVVLFVSENLSDARKGWGELLDALKQIKNLPNLRIMTLGGGGGTASLTGPAYLHLGHLSDPAAIRDAYNAADVFVIPSLQDNFPNTVLEALACGTPVVGFTAGGVADAVEHEQCGLLARTGDTAGLAAQITRALTDEPLRLALASAARRRAVSHYDVARQAQTCLDLYQARLAARSAQFSPGPFQEATAKGGTT